MRWMLPDLAETTGRRFIFSSFILMFVSGLLALLVRWQLAFPARRIDLLGKVFPSGMPGGLMLPDFYNALFTMHATLMVFFGIVPLLLGGFGLAIAPAQIGARTTFFPRMSAAALWLMLGSAVVIVASFWFEGGAAAAGWTSYAPLSVIALGHGQDAWLLSVLGVSVAMTLVAIDLLATIVAKRTDGMTPGRLPLFVWSTAITALIVILSFPVLVAGGSMLLMDRLMGSGFFIPASTVVSGAAVDVPAGGQPLLWQHLFWYFGHPVVYVMILPAMGIVSEILPVFARRPLFGYRAMIVSTAAIAVLGFAVWGHHMFQSGMNPLLGTGFMVATMAIAVPSSVKMLNWLGTLWRGRIELSVPLLHAAAFLALFAIGGLSGIFMASTPVDIFIHDTWFIVAHIHYVLFGGTMFGVFGAVAYWFPRLFGRHLGRRLGLIHFWLTFLSFNGVMFPMHILGLRGMPRRVYDFRGYESFRDLHDLNVFMTFSAMLLIAAQILYVANLLVSLWRGLPAERNPWRATTLEWEAADGNLESVPTVYRGPYEYSRPDADDDFVPQTASDRAVSRAPVS